MRQNRLFISLTREWRFPIIAILTTAISACSLPASTPTVTQPAQELCAEFNSTIDRNIVDIAVSEAEGDTADKSAMQQGARLAQNGNRLSTILINIQLLAQNRCPPRQQPIDTSIYKIQAVTCHRARLELMLASFGTDKEKTTSSKTAVDSACNFKGWNTRAAK